MENDTEAPKDPGVCNQRYTEQDYEGSEHAENSVENGYSFTEYCVFLCVILQAIEPIQCL